MLMKTNTQNAETVTGAAVIHSATLCPKTVYLRQIAGAQVIGEATGRGDDNVGTRAEVRDLRGERVAAAAAAALGCAGSTA